ncbi:radical SAM protein [Tepidimicrobium xylanilyticum]|uniref:Radical SAM superfamily protein n=1 Tax=Tepidimicrobium xylanilyticum TaxID=1123352 RepID=A0A1H3DB86_9FIRM|nr:radical SAM protein [Tepidimicrobium xylanilyticum]GMG97940.1 radical SAM protein [Tepidimicrobium xylanilyticum]SDX62939.1 Radical SAM superfamily protein [Tepidimicrobium xylanilyticum]
MRYEGALYRPPSEAYSLIVQATIGCSHNKCTFCSMYKDKKFRIRDTEEIMEDLILGRKYYENVRRIFLADGDALVIKTEELIKILQGIEVLFPECERIGIYGSPKSILNKSQEELLELKALGLGIVYLGVESGSDKILKDIKKGVDSAEMIEAGRKIVDAGIKLSVTLISGIGGKAFSTLHALESAKVLNEMKPHYIGLLTLLLEQGTKLYEDVKVGKFQLLSPKEVLEETRILVENLQVGNCIFRSNHASNYVALRGTLMEDKKLILKQIEEGLKIDGLDDKDYYRRL